MLKIYDLAVDTVTGELVYITNGINPNVQGMVWGSDEVEEYLPYEGCVFKMDGKKMVNWKYENIQSRTLRKATDEERDNLMPQFNAKCDEIRNLNRVRWRRSD